MKEKLVVHTCCAVCMSYPHTILEDYDSVFYFYNPNIYPISEYERRRDEFINYANFLGINIYVHEENDAVKNWYDDIKGFENEPEKGSRCSICFKHRIRKAFEYAKSINAKYVATVMTVSPHKNSKVIQMIGESLSKEYDGIDYLHFDFKKKDGFKKTNIIANEAGLYRQNYCGCEFSIRD
ncbi:epoxyqueuosine reductase QueH [Brachyspira pulli]|uniref:epoxyqueuosine reductase QueH n=1 Tax=Brachyspira pulli TaxID=310721 RepID=UPI0030043D39